MHVAYYHLPGLFEFYELYRTFLPLFRGHREYFYSWCDIGSIYGAPADCIWGGYKHIIFHRQQNIIRGAVPATIIRVVMRFDLFLAADPIALVVMRVPFALFQAADGLGFEGIAALVVGMPFGFLFPTDEFIALDGMGMLV